MNVDGEDEGKGAKPISNCQPSGIVSFDKQPSAQPAISGEIFNFDRLKLIELMLHHMTIEGERFWQRNGVFITITTGLFGLYAVKGQDFSGAFHIVYGFIGLIIGIGWRHTIIASNFYAERWRLDAREYISRFPELADIMRTAMGRPRIESPKGPKSSKIMIRFAVLSSFFWLGTMGWGVYLITSGVISDLAISRVGAICLRVTPSGIQLIDCGQDRAPSGKWEH